MVLYILHLGKSIGIYGKPAITVPGNLHPHRAGLEDRSPDPAPADIVSTRLDSRFINSDPSALLQRQNCATVALSTAVATRDPDPPHLAPHSDRFCPWLSSDKPACRDESRLSWLYPVCRGQLASKDFCRNGNSNCSSTQKDTSWPAISSALITPLFCPVGSLLSSLFA